MVQATKERRRRIAAPVIITGLVGCLAMVLSMSASLSGFTASISDTTNTATSGALVVTQVASGTVNAAKTCASNDATATCATINLYGGVTLVPGVATTITTTFTGTGTPTAVTGGTLTGGLCVATATGGTGSTTPTTPNTTAGNLCSQVNVKIYVGATATGTPIFNDTAANLTATTVTTLAAWTAPLTQAYTVQITENATGAPQGQTITQPLGWTFNA